MKQWYCFFEEREDDKKVGKHTGLVNWQAIDPVRFAWAIKRHGAALTVLRNFK